MIQIRFKKFSTREQIIDTFPKKHLTGVITAIYSIYIYSIVSAKLFLTR